MLVLLASASVTMLHVSDRSTVPHQEYHNTVDTQ